MIGPVERALGLESLVREHADEADQRRRLPAVVASAFAENGLYRIGAPRDYGGEEADPITQIETIEAISFYDGSAGWNLMIGVESFGLIAPGCGACKHLIDDPMVVMSSSTAAVGKAEKVDQGYRINGQWQFVSGCQNSSVFGATVAIHENGQPVPGNVYAMIAAPDFEILDTWDVSGMRGSGSHDVRVTDIMVPKEQIVAPLGGTQSNQPLLRFPLGARLAYNKVAVALGIARAGLDLFVELAEGKIPRFQSRSLRERAASQRAIAEAEIKVRSSRAFVFDQVAMFWDRAQAGAHITSRERAIFQIACSDAVRACVDAVDLIADAAGTSANFRSSPLERICRDIRVVRQHVTVASHHIDDAGRVLLGLPAEGMMLRGLT